MKITCPNCQKKYTINQAKLPSGIKTAKCKACGQSIPLKEAPAKAPATPGPILKIACQYCGQSHSLQQDKIPSTAKTIKCKSCGRPVSLSQARGTAPVHSLKKELSALAAGKPAAKPVTPPSRVDDLIRFMCAGCGKKYKIGQHKIPPNIVAVKCKACGHNIQLPRKAAIKTADDHGQPAEHQDKTPPTKPDLMSDETPPPVSRPRKKRWLFAAAACVLLVVILGTFVNLNIFKMDWLDQFFPGTVE